MYQQPALFISHGSPTLAIDDCPARTFLRGLGGRLDRPKAIIVVSAHHVAEGVAVTSDAKPETIYDFRGFPDALYEIVYAAPGAPDLAAKVVESLKSSSFDATLEPNRGLDHGAWVPLSLMFPDANVPVVQVSIDMSQTPAWHFDVGRALAPFRDQGVLIIGSGSTTHNLGEFFDGDYDLHSDPPEWVSEFADWIAARIETGDSKAVLDAVQSGPYGQKNHPTMDHIHPMFAALGAGGDGADGLRLHESSAFGVLAMDVHGFGQADALDALRDPNLNP